MCSTTLHDNFPLFQFIPLGMEVESTGDTWGKDEAIIETLIAILEALAFIDRVYFIFIGKYIWYGERASRGTPEHGE